MTTEHPHVWKNEEAVRSLRTDVSGFLDNEIPIHLQNVISNPETQHLLLGEEGNESFFGLYYTYLIADSLDFDKPEELKPIAYATALLRAYVVSHDALIDVPDRSEFEREKLSELEQLFLSEARKVFVASDETGKMDYYFDGYARRYLEETALENARHQNEITPFTEEDFERLGNKTCLVNVPLCALALKVGREDLIPELAEVVKNAMIASQLSDDIRDWESDLEEKNYTYPLTKCVFFIRGDSGLNNGENDPKEFRQVLFSEGVIEDVLEKIAIYFSKANAGIKQIISGSLIEGHLTNVINSVNTTAEQVKFLKTGNADTYPIEELINGEISKWFLPSGYLRSRAISNNK